MTLQQPIIISSMMMIGMPRMIIATIRATIMRPIIGVMIVMADADRQLWRR